MQFYSPLRYPGGKGRLAPFIDLLIRNAGINHCTYIEPFAGGAGVALALLLENKVEQIVINDYDKGIYSIWRAICSDTTELVDLIQNTPVTIAEWRRQKEVYHESKAYSVEFGFSALFLNRTNRSGIITGGPIGGYLQAGDWTLDVRFDRVALSNRVLQIANRRKDIKIYNKDVLSLMRTYIPQYGENCFSYFDPPYYQKGKKLYKNYLNPQDHQQIADMIKNEVNGTWIVTYDDIPSIREMYMPYLTMKYDLTYSVANKGAASEIIVFGNPDICPSEHQLNELKMSINLR